LIFDGTGSLYLYGLTLEELGYLLVTLLYGTVEVFGVL
jgi:hypothetical protein